MRTSFSLAVVVVGLLLFLSPVSAFLLRGVLPKSYEVGRTLEIKVNSLTSITKIMPMSWYSLPWCAPDKATRKKYKQSQNLGEILWGDEIEISHYHIEMLANQTCVEVCPQMAYTKNDLAQLIKRIEEHYRGNMVLDGLPVGEEGSHKFSKLSSSVITGFPLGVPKKYSGTGKTIIHNHLAFTILYHPAPTTANAAYLSLDQFDDDLPSASYRIVGFQVSPQSVDHSKFPCGSNFNLETASDIVTADSEKITWSYSVSWKESDVEWSTRWDVYLKPTKAESRIHWLSIINSLLVVILLSAIIAIILIRALRKDFAAYNDPESIEEDREETGWKLVHGDVFRKPEAAGLLAVCVGTGAQLFCMTFATLTFAVLGFLSPANRGGLVTMLIFLFVLLGSYSGYTTARLAKMWNMKNWKIIFATGLFFPGILFTIYFLLNFVHWGSKSSSATPFTTMLTLMALWFLVSLPLVILGGAMGYRRDVIQLPRKVNSIARTIPPQPWYLNNPQVTLIPGVLPFGAAFIESLFILTSVWQGRIYYVFGFLALVFLIVVITCAELTVVMVYFQLLNLDYQWWWRSFLTSGGYGFWLFAYSAFYYATALQIRTWLSSLLYFGYMGMVSFFFFIMTGTIGFMAAFTFVNKIYSSIKVD